jgi:putative transposase
MWRRLYERRICLASGPRTQASAAGDTPLRTCPRIYWSENSGMDRHGPQNSLHRLPILFPRCPIFFVTTCTHGRRPLLANARVHEAFREFASVAQSRGVCVGRYVLMPDHLHLFVGLRPEGPGLSTWMKSLKNTLSKRLRLDQISSPHWQKGFFDHLLRSTESYAGKWDYVRMNPVRAGLVERSDAWPFAGEICSLER